MNLRFFWTFALAEFKHLLEYRGDVFLYSISNVIYPLVFLIIWFAVLSSGGEVPYKESDFIKYYIFGAFLNLVIASWNGYYIAMRIKNGEINSALLKPYPFILPTISGNIANKVFQILFLVPIFIILYHIFPKDLTLNITLNQFIIFMITLVGAAIINFLFNVILGMLAFWFLEVNSFLEFEDMIKTFLSGQIVPLSLLPVVSKEIINWLPYRYTFSFPLEILIGTLPEKELYFGLWIQFMWVIIAIVLYQLVRTKGFKTYQGFGG